MGEMVAAQKIGPCPNSHKPLDVAFGIYTFADITELRIPRLVYPTDGLHVLVRDRQTQLSGEKKTAGKDKSRDWSDDAIKQGTLENLLQKEKGECWAGFFRTSKATCRHSDT